MVKKSLLWSALVATFGAFIPAVHASSDVISLNQDNFNDNVLHQDLILVEFFAPWCGHCRALAPEYEIAATVLKEEDVKLANVDCSVNGDLCQAYGVRGYPTLKIFRNGNTYDYKGERSAPGIISYMQKQAIPALMELNHDNFESFKNSRRAVAVGFVSPLDQESRAALAKAAENLRDKKLLGIVTDPELAKENNVEDLPTLVVFKQFDNGRDEKVGDFEVSAIEQFVTTSTTPLIDEISIENYQAIIMKGLPLAFLFVDSPKMAKPLLEELKPVAKKFLDRISFVHLDANEFTKHAARLGLKKQWPAFAIQNPRTGLKYIFDQLQEINAASIEAFVSDVEAGKAKPMLLSEEPPKDNNGPVKIVVGSTYNAIVKDTTKDVFLVLYAPWSEQSNRFLPSWTELAELVQNQNLGDKLVIAKLDGTENDLPTDAGYRITAYPTLKFFKAETNEIVDYKGDRSIQDLVKFINTHGSQTYTLELAVRAGEEEEHTTTHDEL